MPQTIEDSTGTTSTAYAGDGRRIKQTRTGANPSQTYFLNPYLEQEPTGLTKYYMAGDQLIARRDPNGTVSYLLQDHLDPPAWSPTTPEPPPATTTTNPSGNPNQGSPSPQARPSNGKGNDRTPTTGSST